LQLLIWDGGMGREVVVDHKNTIAIVDNKIAAAKMKIIDWI
jgi:hypothetical protein